MRPASERRYSHRLGYLHNLHNLLVESLCRCFGSRSVSRDQLEDVEVSWPCAESSCMTKPWRATKSKAHTCRRQSLPERQTLGSHRPQKLFSRVRSGKSPPTVGQLGEACERLNSSSVCAECPALRLWSRAEHWPQGRSEAASASGRRIADMLCGQLGSLERRSRGPRVLRVGCVGLGRWPRP